MRVQKRVPQPDLNGGALTCGNARIRSFIQNVVASVAIEFAIILPILILLLLGLSELRSGFLVKQRTIIAATTMSNIVAEVDDITPTLVDKLDHVVRTILYPHEPAEIDVSIAVVTFNGLSLVIEWEDSVSGEEFPQEVAEEMLAGLLLTSETAVISTVKVAHESLLGGQLFGLLNFEARQVVYPD